MMNDKKLTIIIPVYNSSAYIENCLDSILNQEYKDYNIILVDDNSKDNSVEIISQYVKKYKFISLIKSKENKGAGVSRNKALKKVKTDYVSFIDADDYVEKNYYTELMNQIIDEDADIVVADFYIKYENIKGNDERVCSCLEPEDKDSFLNNGLAASPCNKIFKTKLFKDTPFAENIINEDVATIIPILLKADKIVYNNVTYYNYIQRKNSVQNAKLSEKKLDIFKALDILNERIVCDDNYKKIMDIIVFNQLMMFLIYTIPSDHHFFNRLKMLRKFMKLATKYNLKNNSYFIKYINSRGKKYALYYKFFLKLCLMRLYLLANLSISFMNFYSKYGKKRVTKNIKMHDLIKVAKKHAKLTQNDLKISVVVPNYNYEQFLYQRIYSILNQGVKIHELIILDDCSKDNSRELIDKMVIELEEYINISKVYNNKNSGSAFKQWQKGFSYASGNYVWIAEADDYANKHFLENVTKPLIDKDVVISYCDTAFIDKDGYIFMKTIKPEIDIMKTGHWAHDYVNEGFKEIEEYEFLNCTIANVSSVIFKNDDYHDFFNLSSNYKQVGDYLFYFNIMTKGKVAYSAKTLNYYRVHGNNVTSTTKKQAHFDELMKVHEYINSKIHFTEKQKAELRKRYKFLRKTWGVKIK